MCGSRLSLGEAAKLATMEREAGVGKELTVQ